MTISRRRFLQTTTLGSAGAALGAETEMSPKGMPTRVLGRTGSRVSILARGGGSRFLSYEDEDKALEAMNHAIDLGISYIDTAYGYGNGKSEARVGKIMATRRNEASSTCCTSCAIRRSLATSESAATPIRLYLRPLWSITISTVPRWR
jgi:hypothetical protein